MNYFFISQQTIIHLVFSGTSDLMSLKVEICFGQNATVGVLENVNKKNSSESVSLKTNL